METDYRISAGLHPLPIKDGLNPTRVRVPEEVSPIKAADFLMEVIQTQRHRHPDDDLEALMKRFADQEVVLFDATPISPEYLLSAEQDVFFYRTPAPETPVPYNIPIVYEDNDILVADKPPFMATMPRARHIVETATVKLRRSTGIDDLAPAHRLDRLTSGLCCLPNVAKSAVLPNSICPSRGAQDLQCHRRAPVLDTPWCGNHGWRRHPGRFKAESNQVKSTPLPT